MITYDITRGDRFRLAGIGFEGNKYFSNGLLSRRLLLQPASFASSGRYSQQLLRGDTDSIRGVYLSNGFRDCQVTSTVDDRYNDKKNNLFVSFHIVEGTQSRIADLKIDGNHAISTDQLLGVTGSTKGEPYSEAGVASDRNNILALYYNEGFPEAAFHEEVTRHHVRPRSASSITLRKGSRLTSPRCSSPVTRTREEESSAAR